MTALMPTRLNRLADDADEDTVNLAGGTRSEQRILAVEFRSSDGRSWNAIGGGDTVVAAIVYARESCPDDATWDAVSWNDLWGD